MVGKHLIKAWSATQASIALSSGEAEYYGVVRGAGIALGMQALYKDLICGLSHNERRAETKTSFIC